MAGFASDFLSKVGAAFGGDKYSEGGASIGGALESTGIGQAVEGIPGYLREQFDPDQLQKAFEILKFSMHPVGEVGGEVSPLSMRQPGEDIGDLPWRFYEHPGVGQTQVMGAFGTQGPITPPGTMGRGGLPAYTPPEWEQPAAPDFSAVQAALGGLQDPTAPTPLGRNDVLQATLAGAAGGAARGQSVGQILALAAAGAFNAKGAQKAAYDQELARYEEVQRENVLTKAQAELGMAQSQAKYEMDTALARQEHADRVSEHALRVDEVNMNYRLHMMEYSKPDFLSAGDSIIAAYVGPDGQPHVATMWTDEVARATKQMFAEAKLQSALSGGSPKDLIKWQIAGLEHVISPNNWEYPLAQKALFLMNDPKDPRVVSARQQAEESMRLESGEVEEGKDPLAERKFADYEGYEAELNARTMKILEVGVGNELRNRQRAPK